jgi:hypothetical protein
MKVGSWTVANTSGDEEKIKKNSDEAANYY